MSQYSNLDPASRPVCRSDTRGRLGPGKRLPVTCTEIVVRLRWPPVGLVARVAPQRGQRALPPTGSGGSGCKRLHSGHATVSTDFRSDTRRLTKPDNDRPQPEDAD